MKLKSLILTFLSTSSLAFAVSVSNFGSDTYTILGGPTSFDVSGQTVTALPLAGNDGNSLFGDFASGSQDLSSFIGVVDATVSGSTLDSGGTGTSGTPSSTFNIVFVDNSGFDEAIYSGATWLGLRDSGITTLTFSSFNTVGGTGFDATDVIGFNLVTNGVGGQSINATLTDLSLVPESSAFAFLAGGFGLAWVMVRRRHT